MRKAVKKMIELLSPTWAPPVVEAPSVNILRTELEKP